MLGAHRSVEQEKFQPFFKSRSFHLEGLQHLRFFSDTPDQLHLCHPTGAGHWQEAPENQRTDPGSETENFPDPVIVWNQIEPRTSGPLWEWITEEDSIRKSQSSQAVVQRDCRWDWIFITRRASVSQFDQLLQMALPDSKPYPNLACLALEGSNFHGTHGRDWVAQLGNMHLSTLISHPAPEPDFQKYRGSEWSALAAVAVSKALSNVCGSRIEFKIKWMNDVVAGSDKVAGILTGSKWAGPRLERLVWGIGANVLKTPATHSKASNASHFNPTCVKELLESRSAWLSQQSETQIFWDLVFNSLYQLLSGYQTVKEDGSESVFQAYQDFLAFKNQQVQLHDERDGNLMMEGYLAGVDQDLALLIQENPTSPVSRFRKGRLSICS